MLFNWLWAHSSSPTDSNMQMTIRFYVAGGWFRYEMIFDVFVYLPRRLCVCEAFIIGGTQQKRLAQSNRHWQLGSLWTRAPARSRRQFIIFRRVFIGFPRLLPLACLCSAQCGRAIVSSEYQMPITHWLVCSLSNYSEFPFQYCLHSRQGDE